MSKAPKQPGLKDKPIRFACSNSLHASVKLSRWDKAHNVAQNSCSLKPLTRHSASLANAVTSCASD